MKNLLKVALCLSMVFVLYKSAGTPGSEKIYLGANGQDTTKVEEAAMFETNGEAYRVQVESKNIEWNIEAR